MRSFRLKIAFITVNIACKAVAYTYNTEQNLIHKSQMTRIWWDLTRIFTSKPAELAADGRTAIALS